MSDVLERVRMCVAEAGYDPELVQGHDGLLGWCYFPPLPHDVAWRAKELTGSPTKRPGCLTCYLNFIDTPPGSPERRGCLADRRLVLDCGRER